MTTRRILACGVCACHWEFLHLQVAVAAVVLTGCCGVPGPVSANAPKVASPARTVMQALQDGYPQGVVGAYEAVLNPQFSPADVEAARKYVLDKPDQRSYLVLLALRKADHKTYERVPTGVRVRILLCALGGGCAMDDWGTPRTIEWCREGFSEKALKEIGIAAIPGLESLLDCEHPAMFMSGMVMTSASDHHWRVKDYAAKYIRLILGWEGTYDNAPEIRDKAIDRLREMLREGHTRQTP